MFEVDYLKTNKKDKKKEIKENVKKKDNKVGSSAKCSLYLNPVLIDIKTMRNDLG